MEKRAQRIIWEGNFGSCSIETCSQWSGDWFRGVARDSAGKMVARTLKSTAARFSSFLQMPPTSTAAAGHMRNWQEHLLMRKSRL